MKRSTQSSLLTIAMVASLAGLFSANLQAAEPAAQPAPAPAQRLFASPDDAVKALQAAVAAGDLPALHEIFGPDFHDLLTGDKVQDVNNSKAFAAVMAQGVKTVPEGDDKINLEIGTNSWPMPIPLVKVDGQWRFDTAAGKEEIINRHIGEDELTAIGVCRTYVVAQQQFAALHKDANGTVTYAKKFKSTPGKKDGLYWEASGDEPASPFGPLVAEAHAEGYVHNKGAGPHPFHGYYFRILTRQGPAAPGGEMSYLHHGKLTTGFALAAYPERWDKSGIMTFIVNQDGKVYQQNLGADTARTVSVMEAYNPDSTWTLVADQGILSAVLEK